MPFTSGCLAIFDSDGELVDSERLAVAIDARAIGELGWPITEAEVIELFLGGSEADMFAATEQHLGRPVPVDWDEAWNAEYRRVFDGQLEAVPGVVEAIKAIAAEGFQRCVASRRITREDAAHAGQDRAVGLFRWADHRRQRGRPGQDVVITDMADLPGAVMRLVC